MWGWGRRWVTWSKNIEISLIIIRKMASDSQTLLANHPRETDRSTHSPIHNTIAPLRWERVGVKTTVRQEEVCKLASKMEVSGDLTSPGLPRWAPNTCYRLTEEGVNRSRWGPLLLPQSHPRKSSRLQSLGRVVSKWSHRKSRQRRPVSGSRRHSMLQLAKWGRFD
jgi:hypothetical protein